MRRVDTDERYSGEVPLAYFQGNSFKEKKYLTSGGAIIAITGLDATGKSTITSELKRWLGQHFNTHFLHIGRPKARFETLWFRALLVLKKRKDSELEPPTKQEKSSIIFCIRYLILAYERLQLLKKANRLRANGYIVICDRYPCLNVGKMDSPRIIEAHNNNGFINLMGRLERKLYNLKPVPDMIYNLKIPIEIAIERNQARVKIDKETADSLRSRYKENSDLQYDALNFEVIDTTPELSVVLKELKKKIWSKL